MDDSTGNDPITVPAPISGGGHEPRKADNKDFTTFGTGSGYGSGVAMVAVPPQALKVLRLSGLPCIGTVEVAKLTKALYPLWAWNDNHLWEEPTLMLDYRQVLRSSAAFFTPVLPFLKQYVICLVRCNVISAWVYDEDWHEVTYGDGDYPDTHTIELSISAIYELGLNTGAVRVGEASMGSVILHVSATAGVPAIDEKLIDVPQALREPRIYDDTTIGLSATVSVVDTYTRKGVAWKFGSDCPTSDGTYGIHVEPGSIDHIINGFKDGLTNVARLVPYKNLGITNLLSRNPLRIHLPDDKLSWELSRAFDSYVSLPLKALGYAGKYTSNLADGSCYRGLSQRVYVIWNLVPLTPKWLGCLYELTRVVMENMDQLNFKMHVDYGLTVAYLQGQGPKLIDVAKRLLAEIQGLVVEEKTKLALAPLFETIGNPLPDEPLDLKETWGIDSVEDQWLPETVSATQTVLADYGVSVGQKVWLTFGKRSVTAKVSLMPSTDTLDEVDISSSLLQKLGVPDSWQLKPKITDSLRDGVPVFDVGPVFGVFVRKSANKFGPYSWRTSLCKDLIRRAKRHNALMVAFSPDDIDFENDQIHGYVPEPGGIWKRITVPFPQAVYDRYISSNWDEGRSLVRLRERLQDKGVIFYNTPSFAALAGNKLITARKLSNNEALSSHIPNAWPLKEKTLALALDENPETGVIIKPIFGTQGSGIMIVDPDLSVHVRSNYFRYSKITFGTFDEMYDYISKRVGNNKMLIQPHISTVNYKDRPFALRVIMQKTSAGKWVVNEALANVEPTGGMMVDLYSRPVLLDKFTRLLSQENDTMEDLDKTVKSLAYVVAHELDSIAGGCSEFGVDFVLDETGHLWILEVNSKPWGPERTLPDFRYKRMLWMNRIVRRLKILTGFTY